MSSPLMDPTSVQKICNLTDAAGIVYSGMGPDFRVLVKKGRKAAQQYFRVYQVRGGSGAFHRRHARAVPGGILSGARDFYSQELMPLSQLSRDLATTMQEFTQQG